MAWYIDYTTLTNKFLETSSAIELSGNFTIKFEAKYPAPSFRFMGSGANNSRIELDTTARIRVTNSASTSVTLTFSGIDVTEFNEYEITRAGSTLALSINGVSQSTITLSGTLNFNRFFRNQLSGVSANCSVKYCEITIAGTLTHEYRNTTGAGTSWIDQISGNNAAQSGTWPSDDSEWVFYGSGATYTITLDGGTYSYSGGTASLNRQYQIGLAGGAYSYSGGEASILLNRALQLNGGSYSYSGASVSLLKNRSISLDGGNYSYSGSDVTLTYNSGPAATYTINLDGGSYTYTVSNIDITASMRPDKPSIGFWLSDRGIAGYRRGFNSY